MDAPAPSTTVAALAAMAAALDAVNHAERGRIDHRARLALVEQARHVLARTEALVTVLVAEADRARSSIVVTGTPTTSWLQSAGNLPKGEATGLVLGGQEIAQRPGLRQATLSGQVNTGQARSIAKVMTGLPIGLTPEQRDQAEAFLLAAADHTDATELRGLGARVLDAVAPEAAETPEAIQRRLEAQQRRAHAARSLAFTDDGDGSYRVSGSLPHLQAAPLLKLLQAKVDAGRRAARDLPRNEAPHLTVGQRWADALADLASGFGPPDRAALNIAPESVDPSVTPARSTPSAGPNPADPSATPARSTPSAGPNPDDPSATPEPVDPRSAPSPAGPSSAADARAPEALEPPEGRSRGGLLVPRVPTVAGDRPRVVVTLDYDALRQQVEQAGLLDSGHPISAGDLRRLACDADLVPVVLGAGSELLDYGTTVRLVPASLRRALSLRDGGCTFPRCNAPDMQCEAHHIVPWWAGGSTSLVNLVLLCPHHHGIVEPPRFWSGPPPDRWKVRLDPKGHPEFIPPRTIDPIQAPRPPTGRRGLVARTRCRRGGLVTRTR